MKVSAIVSTYNSEQFMRGCLEDLIIQSLYQENELEIVVVDSGSLQGEKEIVREYQARHGNIVYLRNEERESLYRSWNRAIEAASGKYITTANTDDRHRSDALEILSDALDRQGEVPLVYGDCFLSLQANETFEQNPKTRVLGYPDFFPPTCLLYYQFGPQPLFRREIWSALGGFDESFEAIGDYDFNIRFALRHDALHIPDTLGAYLRHENAISYRDDSPTRELKGIQEKYRTPEIVEQLYRRAGIETASAGARGGMLIDMGLRALGYHPPWEEGRRISDSMFAGKCFRWAAPYLADNYLSELVSTSCTELEAGAGESAIKRIHDTILGDEGFHKVRPTGLDLFLYQ